MPTPTDGAHQHARQKRPRVLVVVASKHGSTAEIAEALGRDLGRCPAGAAAGSAAVVVPAQQRPDPAGFDAVLVGSAVYAGRWSEPARQYVTEHADVLRARPVWLFSSGPIGEPPFPPDEPYDATSLAALTSARAHQVFPDRLDEARLTFGERAMVTAMRAPVGDTRNWEQIAVWAARVAAAVTGPVPAEQG